MVINESVKKNILVVDDDQDILEALSLILRSAGYSVQTENEASNVEKLHTRDEQLPSLILLDILLNGTDGRLVCQTLKANTKTAMIPIIIISAYPDIEQSALKAGADDFLSKPFGMQELLTKMESLLFQKKKAKKN